MDKKFINELPEEERLKIGELIRNMSNSYNELRTILFVYDDEKNATDEKIQASSELMDSFMEWTKGDNFESIGESVFQDSGAMIREIFKTIGVDEDENDLSRFI